jgi:hypothetical protein
MIDSAFFDSLNPAQHRKCFNFIRSRASANDAILTSGDERLKALPHHQRIALHDMLKHEAAFLEEFAPTVVDLVKTPGSTRHEIATTLQTHYPLLSKSFYLDRADVLWDLALRLMVHYGRIRTFQTTDALEQMLMETDFGGDVPAAWFRLPFEEIFIEFGEHRGFPITINDSESGEHIIEGAYVMSGLSLGKPGKPLVRGFDLIIFGSPVGKRTALDDCFIHMGLPINDEEKPISDVVQDVVDFYASQGDFPNKHAFRPVVEHVAKVLVYLGTKDARQHQVAEGSEARRRINALKSPAKREKAQRQAARLYDRIVVGPAELPEDLAGGDGCGSGGVRPHVRRGHFRAQAYGPQHSLRRPVWIQPTLVGKDRISGEVAHPAYVIQ